jgi:transcriptional regulator with XRE-family HTH domain
MLRILNLGQHLHDSRAGSSTRPNNVDWIIVDLGHRLKLFRVAAGLKQGEIAKQLDVSNNHVYMVESGKREPSLEFLTKFAKAVKVPLAVLFVDHESGDAKSKKFADGVLALMAEFADATGVRKRRA